MREDYKRVFATVDLDAIRENMDNMKAGLCEGTKMLGVIKTDGYGHGAVPIAQELEPLDYMHGFAVATVEEALVLRRAGIKKPILILGYAFPYSYKELILQDVRLTVFRRDTLKQLADVVKELQGEGRERKAKVHIKVDTGMSRIGISPDDTGLSFVEEVFGAEGIEVEGIFTHFATADEADKTNAYGQLAVFNEFLTKIEEKGYQIPLRHCANSAAIIEMPEANLDLVRAGIALYGLWPSREVCREKLTLKPALSLYSHVIYIKEIEKGTQVSYGGIYTADKMRRIATIPLGYGDGYPRGLSGKGEVLICGKRAPILGRVCMDQLMVDVTEIPQAYEGCLVTLIGRDGTEEITMEELGDISGRFNYELACDLGKRIPRVYCKGGEILSTKDYYQDF